MYFSQCRIYVVVGLCLGAGGTGLGTGFYKVEGVVVDL